MTIATTTNRVDVLGNGSATTFSFAPVVIFEASDIQVTMLNSAGVETPLTQGGGSANYSVAVSAYPGVGSITYPASGGSPIPLGTRLIIKRIVPLIQDVTLENQGAYLPKVQEGVFDYLTAIAQQEQEQLSRSLQFANTDTVSPILPTALARANGIMGFDSAGNVIVFAPLSGGFQTYTALTVNANPSTEAPAYTAGNSSNVIVNNSVHTVAEQWAILDGGSSHDGVTAVQRIQSGTSVTQVNAIAGYIDNNKNNQATNNGVGVAIGGFTVARVDGAMNWWIDAIMSETRANASPGTPNASLMQGEVDFKPIWANTQVAGLIMTIDTAIQPQNADAYLVGRFGTGGKWITGFRTYDGAALTALNVGSGQATGAANANSQVVQFTGTDGGGVNRNVTLSLQGSGTSFVLSETNSNAVDFNLAKGNYQAGSGQGYYVGGGRVLTGTQHGWAAPSGTLSRATFDQSTVTLAQLAQRLAALIVDLSTHGMIGA